MGGCILFCDFGFATSVVYPVLPRVLDRSQAPKQRAAGEREGSKPVKKNDRIIKRRESENGYCKEIRHETQFPSN